MKNCAYLIVSWLILCLVIVPHVSADDNDQWSFPAYPKPFSIENGDCVPLNATVDISSLGWGVPKITYYGRYMTALNPAYDNDSYVTSVSLPHTARGLKNFFTDPKTFAPYIGYWYQDYGTSEKAANQRMFYLNFTCPQPSALENITVVINETKESGIPEQLPYLPIKKESDILLAKGDTISINASNTSRWWLFGYGADDGVYDREVRNNMILLAPSTLGNISVGNYHLDTISLGYTRILQESFDNGKIVSPFRNVEPADIHELVPILAEPHLEKMVSQSIGNNLTRYQMAYRDPEIQIKRIDALQNAFNMTWYNVRGYTNLMDGSHLTISIDVPALTKNDRDHPYSTWDTKVISITDDAGTWREFNALIPVPYAQSFPGPHWVTVSGRGASQTVQVYIYKELPPHYIPPEYIEYTGVSPFVTPKIVIKEVPVPGPTQIVEVHDTPTDDQLKRARLSADWDVVETIVTDLIAIAIVIFFGWWGWSAYRRTKP